MKRPHSAMGRLMVAGCCGCYYYLSFQKPVDAFSFHVPRFPSSSHHTATQDHFDHHLIHWTKSFASRTRDVSLFVVASAPPLEKRTGGEDDGRDVTDVLLSYRSNIRRTSNLSQEEAKKPIRSLVHYLEQHTSSPTCTAQVVVETLVPALQVAANLNDYRLLLRLWQVTKSFCSSNSSSGTCADALSRLFGETLTCLGRTSASLSKIKQLWKTDSSTVATARETNVYLKLLLSAQKPRLALNVWQAERERGKTNSYSLALILQILQNAVQEEKENLNNTGASDLEKATTDSDDEDGWVLATPFTEWKTNCQIWNEAVELLENDYLALENDYLALENDQDISVASEWTNPVVTALLQLNHRVGETYRHHPESALAEAIWDFFVVSESDFRLESPDTKTCTAFLNCLGKDWETAVALWRSMQSGEGSLPPPNVFTFAATLACCARAGQYEVAWKLLMEDNNNNNNNNNTVTPNTVVYNTVLSALAAFRRPTRPTRWQRDEARDRLNMGLSLLTRMHESSKGDPSCSADTVTYNTLLQIASGGVISKAGWRDLLKDHPQHFGYEAASWQAPERLVHTVLDQMEDAGIPRNELTYRHGISCVRSFQGVIQLVGRALNEQGVLDLAGIFDAAIFVLAQEGDMDGIQLVLSKMIRERVKPTEETLSNILRGLGYSGKSRSIPFFILALMGNDEASAHLFDVHKLDLKIQSLPPLTPEYLTTAITSCLYQNDFENARRILINLRDSGLEPSDESLGSIARSYARLALDLEREKKTDEAISRAQSAYDIIKRLNRTPLSVLAIVTRACAAVGLFAHAQNALRTIHEAYLKSRAAETFYGMQRYSVDHDNELLTGLHRVVLKSAASHGNITFALRIAEDIQSFDQDCEWGQPASLVDDGAVNWSEVDANGEVLPPAVLHSDASYIQTQKGLGMGATEWILILEAAAKSGHWKVCINTLQFLRPYLNAIHPSRHLDQEQRERFNAEYKSLSKGLVFATKCFAVRSQYGWAVRAIEDWIHWSGRRPPKQAVQFSMRILSTRGRGDEVYRLLALCHQPCVEDPSREGKAYEVTLYVSAITFLYKNGLYDAADDVFIAGVSSGKIPFQLEKQAFGVEKRITLDLHGMNIAVARSAVRVALQQEILTNSWNTTDLWDKDVIIVTGRGKKSALHMRPVLRPEVQQMLMEEFYPPLSTTSVPGNMGALRVSSDGIYEWVEHQRQQKGARMLAVAALLKDFSGNRLRKALTKAASAKSNATLPND